MTEATKNKPECTYRIGNLKATVWKNDGKHGDYYTTEIVRTYRDSSDKWQTSSSFTHDDLLNVAKLAERAEAYIAKVSQAKPEESTAPASAAA